LPNILRPTGKHQHQDGGSDGVSSFFHLYKETCLQAIDSCIQIRNIIIALETTHEKQQHHQEEKV
jgi:hypothetical protein